MMGITVQYEPPKPAPTLDLSDIQRAALAQPKPKALVEPVNVAGTFGTNPKVFYQRFYNFKTMSQEEKFKLVADTYEIVLKYASHNSSKDELEVVYQLFSDADYVSVLGDVLNQIYLNTELITNCNRILYDMGYGKIKEENVVDDAMEAYQNKLAYAVNKEMIRQISGLNVPDSNKDLGKIAVWANSQEFSFNNVKRLNRHLVYEGWKQCDEYFLVALYQEIFPSMTILTEGIMFDVWSMSQVQALKEDQQNVFYSINLALLDMLEQCTTAILTQVLRSYSTDWVGIIRNNIPYPRFSMILSEADFPRLTSTIKMLEARGIYMP